MNQQKRLSNPKPQQSTEKKVIYKEIKELNDKYQSKIAKGQIQVQANQNKSKFSASQLYDKNMKQKKIAHAQRQKEELEKKLSYLNKSIQSIKDYDYSKGKASPTEPASADNSPNDPKQLKKRQRDMRQKMKQHRKQFEQKKQQMLHRQDQKQKEQRQLKEKQIQQKKLKKKQQILQNVERIKKRMQGRETQLKKQQQEYKKITDQKKLFQKYQEHFIQRENNILEERKKKLADIRNLHRPISISEIEEHERKFLQIIKQKQSMRDREKRLNNATEEYKVSYKSPAYLRYSRMEKDEEQPESRVKSDKMRQFSMHVKEHFIPEIDERKRESLEKQIQIQLEKKKKADNKVEEQKQRLEQIRNKGLRYLQQIRQLPKKRGDSSKTQAIKTDRPQYKNYLTHSQNSGSTNWKNILSGKDSRKDKAIKVHYQAEKLQNHLRMKQQKTRLLKGDADEIDQQYFQMIKAKLDLLQI